MARPPDPVRRQELLDQVVRYLADHGLAGASLRPMAKALGVSLNGLVHHFGTKTDLIVAALARANELQQRESEGWLACNPALSQADLLRKWWRWINAAPEHLALVRLGLEAAALDATGGGLPGQVRAEQVGLWRTDIEQRLVAEGLSAGAAQVEASLVKAMFTGLVVDLIATGNRRRLTRALREGLHRLEAVVASARVGAVEQPARARPLAPPVVPCEPADLSPLVLVSGSHTGGADR
jgi:AcrR family transcriptional regulator